MITAIDFFKAWCSVTESRKAELIMLWSGHNAEYTYLIKGSDNSIVKNVADELSLKVYESDYYSIDSVFYEEHDRLTDEFSSGYYFHSMRVAFEHENHFKSGLYKETSHLLLLNCELRVLVSYPDDDSVGMRESLHSVIKACRVSDQVSEEGSFLAIFGYQVDSNLEWEGFVYRDGDWEQIL